MAFYKHINYKKTHKKDFILNAKQLNKHLLARKHTSKNLNNLFKDALTNFDDQQKKNKLHTTTQNHTRLKQ